MEGGWPPGGDWSVLTARWGAGARFCDAPEGHGTFGADAAKWMP